MLTSSITMNSSCPPKKIIDSVYENCYDEGYCNAESWEVSCLDSTLNAWTVVVTAPEGQCTSHIPFPAQRIVTDVHLPDQPWIKNGFVEAMNAAVKAPGLITQQNSKPLRGGGCVGCT